MPDEGATGRPENTQGTVGPDVPPQANAPQADSMRQPPPPPPPPPGQGQYGQQPYAQQPYAQRPYSQDPYSQDPYTQQTYGQAGQPGMPGRLMVPRDETRVTGRRVVQYIIDMILAGIVPGLAYWLFDRSNGTVHNVGWFVASIIAIVAYFLYWVVLPYGHRGQTFGMQLMRIHVIGKDGSKASMLQLFVRWVFLIIDGLLLGLVGFVVILCSKHRQRVGDHVAKTVVVPASYGDQI
ncbi:MAG TPA: RDD family protein [Streptosporangiaceae bacterium]|nr:RDD family protein [Streptosporangiaceae bacterium]